MSQEEAVLRFKLAKTIGCMTQNLIDIEEMILKLKHLEEVDFLNELHEELMLFNGRLFVANCEMLSKYMPEKVPQDIKSKIEERRKIKLAESAIALSSTDFEALGTENTLVPVVGSGEQKIQLKIEEVEEKDDTI